MKKLILLPLIIMLLFSVGCTNGEEKKSGVLEADPKPHEKSVIDHSNYEVSDSEIAGYLNYNYQDRRMYIAGLKVFEEFGKSNEGNVSIHKDKNYLTFVITKSTGSITGTLDGPLIYFTMNLDTNEIIEKEFKPAPNYEALGMTEFIEHSEEVVELTDERMVEIGKYFKELIMEIEAN